MAGGLEPGGELFTPDMPNAENAWLLAKMQTNCAGHTLHPVFKLLRPHVLKTVECQQTICNCAYDPYAESFPATREANGAPGVYNIGFLCDLIVSCGRIGTGHLDSARCRPIGALRRMAVSHGVAVYRTSRQTCAEDGRHQPLRCHRAFASGVENPCREIGVRQAL